MQINYFKFKINLEIQQGEILINPSQICPNLAKVIFKKFMNIRELVSFFEDAITGLPGFNSGVKIAVCNVIIRARLQAIHGCMEFEDFGKFLPRFPLPQLSRLSSLGFDDTKPGSP